MPRTRKRKRAWPVVQILDEHDGQYLLQWEGDWLPTWEPENNVSHALIAEWNTRDRQQDRKATAGGFFLARAILDERGQQYLIDWCPDGLKGETYEPSWVLKKDVTAELVAEWKQTRSTTQHRTEASKQRITHGSSSATAPPPTASSGQVEEAVQGLQQLHHGRAPSAPATDPVPGEANRPKDTSQPAATNMNRKRDILAELSFLGRDGGTPRLTTKSVYGIRRKLFK
ncbi:hypothetical protein JOL62DRAFT_553931 [Phyllosticta paracitricarpa]|uniref:Chromo domain-containing protein n=1 Tax=Phyllosticta paracitricarpa TaxID=2016321 RepID=A0ABR1NH23_9PEZI